MTTTVKEEVLTIIAGEDLRSADKKYKLVSIAGTLTNNTRLAAGLLLGSVNSGQHAGAVYQGVSKAWAAAAVTTIGWPFSATTSGWTTNAVSGAYSLGRYLDTCNSGDVVRVLIDAANFGYQNT